MPLPLLHPTLVPLPPRQHAWHRPLELRMALPWLTLASSFGAFYGFSLHGTPGWQWWTLAQLICVAMVLGTGIMVTVVSLPFVGEPQTRPWQIVKEANSTCQQCNLPRIAGGRTHHCSWCNRCSDEFDHHCRWLNICISGNNFLEFMALHIFSLLTFAIQIAFSIYAGTVQVYSPSRIAGVVLLSILPVIAIALLCSSLGFQAYLYWWLGGKTTHEYIRDRDTKRGEQKLENEMKRVESRRSDIEKEQQAVRAEWLRQREKEKSMRGGGGGHEPQKPTEQLDNNAVQQSGEQITQV